MWVDAPYTYVADHFSPVASSEPREASTAHTVHPVVVASLLETVLLGETVPPSCLVKVRRCTHPSPPPRNFVHIRAPFAVRSRALPPTPGPSKQRPAAPVRPAKQPDPGGARFSEAAHASGHPDGPAARAGGRGRGFGCGRAVRARVRVRVGALADGQSAPLGSAPVRPLCLLSAHLAALGSSVLPERGPATGCPATASGARAIRLQSRRFRCFSPFRSTSRRTGRRVSSGSSTNSRRRSVESRKYQVSMQTHTRITARTTTQITYHSSLSYLVIEQ